MNKLYINYNFKIETNQLQKNEVFEFVLKQPMVTFLQFTSKDG